MNQVLSASDLLSGLPDFSHMDEGQLALKHTGAGLDTLEGLHNNILAFAQQQEAGSPQQRDQQQQQQPGSSRETQLRSSMSCDLDLLTVDDLPHNPPEPHPPVIPQPAQLSNADIAGFLYAEPTYYQAVASGMPRRALPVLHNAGSGSLGEHVAHPHLQHAVASLHPAYHHHPSVHHPAMLPHAHPAQHYSQAAPHHHQVVHHHGGMATAYHPPLLGNPAVVLARPGLAHLHTHTPQPAHAPQQRQQGVSAGGATTGTTSGDSAANGSAGGSKAAAEAGAGGRPGSPSFLQAALALLKPVADGSGAAPAGAAGPAGSGATDSSGTKSGGIRSSSSGGGNNPAAAPALGASTPRSAFEAATAGVPAFGTALQGVAAAPGSTAGQTAPGLSPRAGSRPVRQSAAQAASLLNKAAQGSASDGGSVLDDEDDEGLEFSDEQGPSPRGGAGAKGGKKGQGAGGKPRSNAAYDALVDPSLPPDEARRLRRMLSNRESARRSRRRRQTHLSTLETQVEALRGEKERLQSELSSTSQAMRAVVAEKQRLQLEVEALRRKMAQMAAPTPEMSGHGHLGLPPQHPPAPSHALHQHHQSHQHAPQQAQHAAPPSREAQQVDELQAEWGRFGVALGGLLGGGGAGSSGRASVNGGRKIERPPSLQRISSMEQMPKKSRDCPENRSPPTVLDGLPEDLIQGGSAFGVLC